MKNERITIPENTRVIIEDGVIIFERKENPVLKVGEWHDYGFGYKILWLGNNKGYCLAPDGFCSGITDTTSIKPNELSLSDMSKVKELLIKEAEKMGFKKGVTAKGNNNARKLISDPYMNMNGILANDNESGWVVLFDFKTGKWAEIIEEKKPLYLYFIRKSDNAICEHPASVGFLAEDEIHTRSMTKRECHQYLADNWDE